MCISLCALNRQYCHKTKRKGQIQTKGAFGKRVQGNAPRRSSSKQQSGTSSTLYSNLDRVKRANERRG